MTRKRPIAATKEKSITLAPHATALTIAGSDPSGGAGLQADLKTFQQLKVYGMSVVTLLTVQNTREVRRVEVLSPQLIESQFDAVVGDIPPRAVKTGALGSAEVVELVSQKLRDFQCPVVIDPVLVSKHGHSLVTDDVVQAYKEHLIPQAYLLTPNRFETERLTGIILKDEDAVARAILSFQELGAQHVLIKLGELNGRSHHVLSLHEENVGMITPRLTSNNTHGTGCILSAAIAAKFALGESDLRTAVLFGIHRTYEAIHVNTKLGRGIHPAETRAMSGEE
jgi:hydroxymethylpyrimidine/phosphomethylpyrimidine kinase